MIDKLSLVGKKRGGNEWNGLGWFYLFEIKKILLSHSKQRIVKI